MSQQGRCDFCDKVKKVHVGPGGSGAICEKCADEAICDFLGGESEEEEDES